MVQSVHEPHKPLSRDMLLMTVSIAGQESGACWLRLGFAAPETLNPRTSPSSKP